MLVIYANPGSGASTQHLHRHVFVLRLEDDGQVKQPVRLLPVLEAANPGAGPVGAGGPGPDGGAGPERHRERRFLPGGGGQSGPRHFQPVMLRPELAQSRHGRSDCVVLIQQHRSDPSVHPSLCRTSCPSLLPSPSGELLSPTSTLCWLVSTCCCEAPSHHIMTFDL